MDGLAVREETPRNNREAEGEVLTHFLLHSFLSSFLGLKLLGLRIVPSLDLLSLSGSRQPLWSQFWQLPNTFMVRKCSLANIGALTFTSKVSCRSLIWFSSMSSLSSGGPLFSLSRTEYQAGRECPISRFGEMFRSLRRKKPCRHQPQVANDSGYQAESSL